MSRHIVLSVEQQRRAFADCVASSFRGIAYAAPWALLIAVIEALAVSTVVRSFAWEARDGRWARAIWESAFDDRGFGDAVIPRVAASFDASLAQARWFLLVTVVVLVVSTTWLQSLMATSVLEGAATRWGVTSAALRRWPAVACAWIVSWAVLGALGWFLVRPALESGIPWIAWPAGAAAVGLLVLVIPRLLLIPSYAVLARNAPVGLGWLAAIGMSISELRGRVSAVWGIAFSGALLPVAAVVVVLLVLIVLVGLAGPVIVSGVLVAGISVSLSALTTSGATAICHFQDA